MNANANQPRCNECYLISVAIQIPVNRFALQTPTWCHSSAPRVYPYLRSQAITQLNSSTIQTWVLANGISFHTYPIQDLVREHTLRIPQALVHVPVHATQPSVKQWFQLIGLQ